MLAFVIFSSTSCFNLLPIEKIGPFQITDIGLLCLLSWGFFSLFVKQKSHYTPNSIVILLLFYFLMCGVHAIIASDIYPQGIVSSFIRIRHQFYYLILFIMLRRGFDETDWMFFLKMLYWLSFAAIVLGFVNYGFGGFLNHKWAEGHGIRSGVVRLFFPAMGLISFTAIWSFVEFMIYKKGAIRSVGWPALSYVTHILRQSRVRLLCLTAIITYHLYKAKRFKILVVSALAFVLLVFGLQVYTGSNIVAGLVELTESEIDTGYTSGSSMRGRLYQLDHDIEQIKEHWIYGNSSVAISITSVPFSKGFSYAELTMLASTADIGLTHFVESFGVIGVIWLLFLWKIIFMRVRLIPQIECLKSRTVAVFGASYQGFVLMTFPTLNHYMKPELIVLNAISLAALFQFTNELKRAKNNAK